MLFLVGLTGLTGFIVAFRSVNVLVFDWLIRKYETFSLVSSWCLRYKLKLACDLKSLSRNEIIRVLFSIAVVVLVPVQWFWASKSCMLIIPKVNWVFLNKRSKADFTVGNIFFTNISEGTAFLLQGVTNSDGVKLRRYILK